MKQYDTINALALYKSLKSQLPAIVFILKKLLLGYLSETLSLLGLGDGKCVETKELARKKLESIKSKIKDLSSMAHALERLIESCEDNSEHKGCPIIKTISRG